MKNKGWKEYKVDIEENKIVVDLWSFGHRLGIFYEVEVVDGKIDIEGAQGNLTSFRECSKGTDRKEYQFYSKEYDICILEDKVIKGWEAAYKEVTEY